MPHLMKLPYTMDDFDFVAGVGRYRYGITVRRLAVQDAAGPGRGREENQRRVLRRAVLANNLALLELGRLTGGNSSSRCR